MREREERERHFRTGFVRKINKFNVCGQRRAAHPDALFRSHDCMLVPIKKRPGTLTLSHSRVRTGRRPSFHVSGLISSGNIDIVT
jgi:hypothetical protein